MTEDIWDIPLPTAQNKMVYSRYWPDIYVGGLKEQRETLARIANVPAQIRTEYFPNASQVHNSYAN
jgi:hypothetical protein